MALYILTCFIVINQLILWDPPVNCYRISQRQGSISNPRHSVSWHQLFGTLCLQLRKVPLPSPLTMHIWKPNCSLLRLTFLLPPAPPIRTLWHTTPPIECCWHWQCRYCADVGCCVCSNVKSSY